MKSVSRVRLGAVAGLLTSLSVVTPSFASNTGAEVAGGAAVVGVAAFLFHHHHHKAKTTSTATDVSATTPKHRSRKAKTAPASTATDTGSVPSTTP